ncbi:hypothetical protein SKAU_G00413710 [Synaphobranchus kaupii]|uniref:Uncharacterized protein n=1 Tax=Synaphobranchus kaupii TaxID=118154 RepID=A0A9Q1IBY1_SYNKA|nr:hypothetical protein SKAU_G00413710 [Synaphobranchus kaupii]
MEQREILSNKQYETETSENKKRLIRRDAKKFCLQVPPRSLPKLPHVSPAPATTLPVIQQTENSELVCTPSPLPHSRTGGGPPMASEDLTPAEDIAASTLRDLGGYRLVSKLRWLKILRPDPVRKSRG